MEARREEIMGNALRLRPIFLFGVCLLAGAAAIPAAAQQATPPKAAADSKHGSLAEVGHKLSNPLSNVWALFTEFDFVASDGDRNSGHPNLSGAINFQPVLPVPLYGTGSDGWKVIVRPSVPIVLGSRDAARADFERQSGLSDILLPLPVAPPVGDNWILGAGPTFTLPAATRGQFGRKQWAIGPTALVGYKTKKYTIGVFPQYFFGVGSRGDQGDTKDASYGEFLYFAYWNLPDAWQIGVNPVITYDHKARSQNRWNVPLGFGMTKTVAIGKRPVKFQFAVEYSIVSQKDYGKRFMMKLNVIPVIASLIQNPIFGGD
jgi:hypothetical protein